MVQFAAGERWMAILNSVKDSLQFLMARESNEKRGGLGGIASSTNLEFDDAWFCWLVVSWRKETAAIAASCSGLL